MTIAVVTDSTAYLPAGPVADLQLSIVPLNVAISGQDGREGEDVTPADVARALQERRVAVTTSRPSPTEFATEYGRLISGGATGIVSVHLSGKLSGTCESAQLAAAEFGDRVCVVDAASAGMAVGFAAMSAAREARTGGDLSRVRDAAHAAAARTTTLFYVDTLEFLRRGGRIGAASALVGTALSVKPILEVADGQVRLREKVRTASRALARLVDLAVEAADQSDVDVAVHHLAATERASALVASLRERLGPRIKDEFVSEVGAVVGAHAGPGLAGIVVHRRP
jgi:fatty acid kinase fatty acid binding subunit